MSSLILGVAYSLLIVAGGFGAGESSRDISNRISNGRENLSQIRSELTDLDQRIASSEQYLNQRRIDLADATSRLRDAEDNYNKTLILYEGRISSIYKLGESDFYSVLLSSDDFSDAMARFAYLSKISENDERLVARVKTEAEAVRQMRARVDEIKQAQVDDVNGLQLRKQQLESQVASEKARIDSQLAELEQVQAREQEEESRRQAAVSEAFDGSSIYSGFTGPSVVVANQPPSGLQPTGITMSGIASWYGPGFQGNRTADGEIYNMYAYTAAHKTLPFNTWIRVTHDGRSVFVRINDRGPYVGGRIIDLSYTSAQAIGISGIGFVSAEIYR